MCVFSGGKQLCVSGRKDAYEGKVLTSRFDLFLSSPVSYMA